MIANPLNWRFKGDLKVIKIILLKFRSKWISEEIKSETKLRLRSKTRITLFTLEAFLAGTGDWNLTGLKVIWSDGVARPLLFGVHTGGMGSVFPFFSSFSEFFGSSLWFSYTFLGASGVTAGDQTPAKSQTECKNKFS